MEINEIVEKILEIVSSYEDTPNIIDPERRAFLGAEMRAMIKNEINKLSPKEDIFETKNFETALRPLLSYLCREHNPHTSVIVTPTGGEILQGVQVVNNINDYIVD